MSPHTSLAEYVLTVYVCSETKIYKCDYTVIYTQLPKYSLRMCNFKCQQIGYYTKHIIQIILETFLKVR